MTSWVDKKMEDPEFRWGVERETMLLTQQESLLSIVAALDVVQSLLSDMRRTAQEGLPQELERPKEGNQDG